ncbi:adenosylcobinamide-GDP ribazoletransferase [Methanocaldococcus fervens]|uniref:Adenosylcobinamide-GDP ribazoletransferase n=1 Tax=Methanocaldococcus fervens (strain DSM 4213 / JCM 15782 / AG86) TaxID=573064 RepID=C7P641_METFA|nr:adenosylcobinamide-GDP ribazoletransferase [Methanocaldococcus fervens]ACV24023.1 cobalamin 5'-phosphate synthase [Methanocaldococcus fervens AG86]
MFREFKALLSFFTRIPTYVEEFDFERIANYFYLIVLIGYIFGIFSLIMGYVFNFLLPNLLAAVLILFFIEYLNGFHHIDGLIDFGDGWMAVGDKRKKLMAMKDRYIGCGGLVFAVFINLLAVASISYILDINIFYLLAVEVCTKLGMLSCSTFGNPLIEGTGRYFVKKSDEKFLTIGIILALPLILIFDGIERKIIIIAIITAIISGLCMAKIAKKHFGGVNGDVLGASNEITRVVVLIAVIISTNLVSLIKV